MENSFNENLKEAMSIAHMTTKQLAEATGLNAGTISSYLKTKGSIPNIIDGYKISKALHVTISFLVTGFEENTDIQQVTMPKKFFQYKKTLDYLDSMPNDTRTPIVKMISDIGAPYLEKKEN